MWKKKNKRSNIKYNKIADVSGQEEMENDVSTQLKRCKKHGHTATQKPLLNAQRWKTLGLKFGFKVD